MKELSIEQKAKAYDKAIETFDVILNLDNVKESGTIFVDDIRKIFPELKESKDERIIRMIENTLRDAVICERISELSYVEMSAYLKKQKEQKPATIVRIPKFRVGDIIQHVPLESWDRSRKIKAIDKHGYYFDTSHLGDNVSGGFIGFSFEDEYELVEQKPAEWSEEDERVLYNIIQDYEDKANGEKNEVVKAYINKIISWLKSLKDRVGCEVNCTTTKEWSEDDQSNFNELGSFIFETYRTEDASRLITWLNDIKDRVQPQPKQEWSEEEIENCAREAEDNSCIILAKHIRQLKSLRPQSTWKPSDEQMRQLHKYCPDNRPLTLLYEQLKKLKGFEL